MEPVCGISGEQLELAKFWQAQLWYLLEPLLVILPTALTDVDVRYVMVMGFTEKIVLVVFTIYLIGWA